MKKIIATIICAAIAVQVNAKSKPLPVRKHKHLVDGKKLYTKRPHVYSLNMPCATKHQ